MRGFNHGFETSFFKCFKLVLLPVHMDHANGKLELADVETLEDGVDVWVADHDSF